MTPQSAAAAATPTSLRQAAKSNGTVALLVQRQDARIYVPLRPGH